MPKAAKGFITHLTVLTLPDGQWTQLGDVPVGALSLRADGPIPLEYKRTNDADDVQPIAIAPGKSATVDGIGNACEVVVRSEVPALVKVTWKH